MSKYTQRDDSDWIDVSKRWLEITAQIEVLKEKQKELREELIQLADSQSSAGGGVRLLRSIRKGTIQYAEIPELKEIDLEQYRKAPTEGWTLSHVRR